MAKVGKKTGKKTQAGKDVYKTPEGKNVSEISSTFEYKGKWINVPSIHKGYEYDDDTLRLMLEAGVIKPTSVHDSRTEAEAEAEARSDRLKFSEGGMAIEEQMMMDFGEVPDNTVGIDPVSGNEIPLGSTAKNVRDDIPAQLSEGEMVIPADVVRFFGVKFFEDIRKAAKIGYAKMDADGRIGGEPIMEDDSGLGLEMSDLEVIDMGDGSDEMMEETEEAFLGKFFAGIRESNRKQAEKNKQSVRDKFKAAEKRKSVDRVKNRTKKDKPKNRYEQLREQMRSAFRDDDDDRRRSRPSRPTVERSPTKPATLDFGFRGNPMERGARKFGGKTPQKKEAGQIEEAYTGENLRSDESFGQRFMKGLGYDEGGLGAQPEIRTDPDLFRPILPDDQRGRIPRDPLFPSRPIDDNIAQEGIKGGFGEELGLGESPFEGVMEAREYQNAAGHKIIIMFLDGEPMQEIPSGYYPVGSDPVPVDPGEQTGSSGGGGSDDDDGPDMPEPFDYKALTIDELTTEVKNLKTPPPIGFGLLGSVLSFAQKRHNKKTIEEIDRRLEATDLPIYEREYLENLKEVAEGPQEKGVVGKFIDKITGEEVEDPDLPKLDGPTFDMLPDQYGVTEAYTPEIKTPDTPTAGYSPEIMEQIKQASKDAADVAFKDNPLYTGYKPPSAKDDDDDDDKRPTFVSTPATTKVALDNQSAADEAMGRPTSSSNDDDDKNSIFKDPTPSPSPPPPSYTAPSNDPYAEDRGGRRSGGGGRNQGGLMKNNKKKATKKKANKNKK